MTTIEETTLTIIAEETKLEGKLQLNHITRIHGTISGDVIAKKGSTVILCETGVIEGNIQGDEVIIAGFIKGDISATSKIVLASSGRVIGNIKTPSLSLEHGAYFEGNSQMDNL
ncbi:MAG: polymer-forming cytoskeletal protein [Deltaproteobacteria bacterium]|nr:polymer-forming cytoskeletal protein [Deltaproteobacteria bacterium]